MKGINPSSNCHSIAAVSKQQWSNQFPMETNQVLPYIYLIPEAVLLQYRDDDRSFHLMPTSRKFGTCHVPVNKTVAQKKIWTVLFQMVQYFTNSFEFVQELKTAVNIIITTVAKVDQQQWCSFYCFVENASISQSHLF